VLDIYKDNTGMKKQTN